MTTNIFDRIFQIFRMHSKIAKTVFCVGILNASLSPGLTKPIDVKMVASDQSIIKNGRNKTIEVKVAQDRFNYKNSSFFGDLFAKNLVIHPESFLGEPMLARLDAGDTASYRLYVLSIPFNVPAVKNRLGVRYRFVRVASQLTLMDNNQEIANEANNLKIQVIYPTNSFLSSSFENTKEVEATAQPSWAGASGGSIRALNRDVDKYSYNMATVAGFNSSRDRSVSWTFYPAKRQSVILGNKVGYAIIAIPKGGNETMSLLCRSNLTFQLSIGLPFVEACSADAWQIKVSDAAPLSDFLFIHKLDMLDGEFKSALADSIGERPHAYTIKDIEHTPIATDESGHLLTVSGNQLIPLEVLNSSGAEKTWDVKDYKNSNIELITTCKNNQLFFNFKQLVKDGCIVDLPAKFALVDKYGFIVQVVEMPLASETKLEQVSEFSRSGVVPIATTKYQKVVDWKIVSDAAANP